MTEPTERRAMPLHTRILIGLVAGAAAGGGANALLGEDSELLKTLTAWIAEPIGTLFLRLLLLLVVPLVFSSLVVGIAGLGDIRKIGRVGVKCLVYTVIISAISVVIGLTVSNVIRPGERIDPEIRAQLQEKYGKEAASRVETSLEGAKGTGDSGLMKTVKTLVPTNPVASAAKDTPDMLGIMFFALFFGVALTLIPEEKAKPVIGFLDGVFDAIVKCIQLVMRLAPYAVFCLLFNMTASFGFGLLTSLGWYVGTVLLGLAIHMFGVYSAAVAIFSRINPLEFFKRIRTVIITAFSTSSSNATLPTAMKVSEENLGVPREINSFVLTVGATANQNGTALFEGVTVLFLAQLAGVDLTITQQLTVLYLAILGGIGTAGVPSGSIPFVVVILSTVGINPELIAIILGVDRLLDMCRTTLNVTGDLTVATYVARSEGYELLKMPDNVAPAEDL
ncbi:MAG: dicarboxylate/amino acid:cation symporter [Thermoanaerobaculia bacterium]